MNDVMSQWRIYQDRNELLQNHSYVTKVLGIQVPLSESGSVEYTAELREHVLSEQMVFEAFMDTMKKWVKQKAGEVPNLFKSIYKLMKNSETIGPFVDLIESEVIDPMINNVRKALEKIKRSSTGIAQKIIEYVNSASGYLSKTADSWKKVLLAITVAVLLKKLAYALPSAAAEKGLEQAKSFLALDILKKAASESASFEKWLGFMTGAVGTVAYVASTISPATEKFMSKIENKMALREKFSPDDFKDVYNTARMAHVGQSRRDGSEYFSHPSEVRNITAKFYPKDRVAQLAALLHDSLEDAPGSTVSSVEEMEEFIKGSIQDPAAGDEVIRVVRALTHEKGGDYQAYVIDLLGDIPTLRVKLSDMVHNLTDNPSPKQKAKYASALNTIAQKTGGNAPQGISDNHWNTLMSLIEDRMSEEVWDKDDGEYQRSIVKPTKAKITHEELRGRVREAILDRLAEEPAKGKKYSKTVTNKKTGRKKKVSYGAKGYRIAPGTDKGDSYCARSYGIKKGLSKDKQNDPNTPNNLSRKKWRCSGKKSMKEEFSTDEALRTRVREAIMQWRAGSKVDS